jgi:predicted dehydrogenase
MDGAVIGFGTIAVGHADAYRKTEKINIKAVVDPLLERRKYAEALIPNIRTYESLNELFSHEYLDFIDICAPPHTHFDYICAGLSNNCHIICEKPLLQFVSQYEKFCLWLNSLIK